MVLMTFLIKLIMLNDIKYNVKRDISGFKGHLSFIYEIERVQKKWNAEFKHHFKTDLNCHIYSSIIFLFSFRLLLPPSGILGDQKHLNSCFCRV